MLDLTVEDKNAAFCYYSVLSSKKTCPLEEIYLIFTVVFLLSYNVQHLEIKKTSQ
jgi:hypothetical protein